MMAHPATPHPDPADRPETPIGRLARRWLTDSGPSNHHESEQETADRCDRLADGLESLTKLPANSWADADAKLIILSVRLRQAATTTEPETLLLALLATSIQHDLLRLRL
ncbi:hypothetical protein ABNQ39_14825 [Azospirillum sp. A26]|uniref:hypothetical protein n=1 Tax=Azospirillum sp. A26 TaxID=3160607 RepID=UPI003671079E